MCVWESKAATACLGLVVVSLYMRVWVEVHGYVNCLSGVGGVDSVDGSVDGST